MLFNWFGYNLGTYLLNTKRWHPKLVIGTGGLIALSGVFASSFVNHISTYLVLYCCFNGIGCGMAYFVPLVCGWEFFPAKKGLVTGIIISAYGFGSFGFGLLAIDIVNPDHVNPSIQALDQKFYTEDIADNVPHMIRALVYMWVPLVLIGVLLVTRREMRTDDPKTSGPLTALDNTVDLTATEIEGTDHSEPARELKHWKYLGQFSIR